MENEKNGKTEKWKNGKIEKLEIENLKKKNGKQTRNNGKH